MYIVTPVGLKYIAEKPAHYGKSTNGKRVSNKNRLIKSPAKNANDKPKIGKYIDPKSDFGVKRLFGQRNCGPRLRAFLNSALADHQKVGKLTYINKEMTGYVVDDRTAIADIICHDSYNQNIMLEMQASNKKNFISRGIYYLSMFVSSLGEKGPWDYNIEPTTMINMVDFDIPDDDIDTNYIEFYRLAKERNNHPLSDKIMIVYINLRRFNKQLSELVTPLDKWLYLFKNLSTLKEMPEIFNTPMFKKIFQDAEFVNLKPEEKMKYKSEMKALWDKTAELEFAKDKGIAEGRAKGIAEGRAEGIAEGRTQEAQKALKMKEDLVRTLLQEPGFTLEKIALMTKVPLATVNRISKEEVLA